MTYNEDSLIEKLSVIKDSLENCNFELYSENDVDIWNAIESSGAYTNENATYRTGASKFCIIPKETDYVIKIPFNSLLEEEYWDNDDDESSYEKFLDPLDDYCDIEAYNYKIAKEQYPGAEMFLAETKFLYSGFNICFYIQEKATVFNELDGEWDKRKEVSKSYKTKNENSKIDDVIYESCYDDLPPVWLRKLLEYGLSHNVMENVNQFINFLAEYQINDLYGNNLGFIGDKPVLFDYSGWEG